MRTYRKLTPGKRYKMPNRIYTAEFLQKDMGSFWFVKFEPSAHGYLHGIGKHYDHVGFYDVRQRWEVAL